MKYLIDNNVKVTERGWAGHLIVSSECRFRRNTLIEYKNKKWIVSTVGGYVTPNGKVEAIGYNGYNRWYETMIFEGKENDGYIDADVTKEIHTENEWGIWGKSWEEIMIKYPNVDNYANAMHEKIVNEMFLKIQNNCD